MWNHNYHYHNYLLSQLPSEMNRVLDIGCGLGYFASKLATRSQLVDAIDIDHKVIKEASKLHNSSNISYQYTDFININLPPNSFDAIVFIASIHHMDLEAALNKMKLLLRPSGILLILGLYRETTIIDYAYSVISVPVNYVYLKRHSKIASISKVKASTHPTTLSLKQIKLTANSIIPNYEIKRHLFWRYSLIWQKQ